MSSKPITRKATVVEALPNARYRVQMETGDEVLAHVSGDMRMHVIRILPGDEVRVQVSPFDRTLGRITFRGQNREQEGEPGNTKARVET